MKHALFTLILLLSASNVVIAGDFEDGTAALKRDDYATAVAKFTKAAEAGNTDAQVYLSAMYSDGRGVSEDKGKMMFWLTKAAKAGNAQAQNSLSSEYERGGKGVPQDDGKALFWLTKAAEAGYVFTWDFSGMKSEDSAQQRLGMKYETGQGAPQDFKKAVRWYTKAAEAGNAEAQFRLAVMYAQGKGVPEDERKMMFWLTKAAEAGNAEAQSNIAMHYEHGTGVSQDDGKMMFWLTKAAEQGDTGAQLLLAINYHLGERVPQDFKKAAHWYTKAAEAGNTAAQVFLGQLYENGQGVTQDIAQAERWYTKAAERGKNQLALMFMLGPGSATGRQYSVQAVRWLTKAADEGNTNAQARLAEMYKDGTGVPKDDGQAVRWYRKAAEQGDAYAQYNLGVMYDNGQGVPQYYGEAVRWYTKAAETGHTSAQYNLGVMYDNGQGVPQDYVLAHMWTNLAALKNGKYVEKRDAIARRMTPHQIAEAQKLAREWKPTTGTAPAPQHETGRSEPAASGTGFVVSRQGHVLTNHHVIEGCTTIRATTESGVKQVTVVGTDPGNDLAVLKLPSPSPNIARFREGRTIRPGDSVVVVGFPLHGVLASEANVTTGTVSALAGIRNDTRFLQITAPVQPGNSGGPLFDQSGQIVGIVVSKLDTLKLAKATGDISQNINFAINGGVAKSFLDSHSVEYETSSSSATKGSAEIGTAAKKFTLLVECYR